VADKFPPAGITPERRLKIVHDRGEAGQVRLSTVVRNELIPTIRREPEAAVE
jgi:hypothetical protein